MIRTFEFGIEKADYEYDTSEVESKITIDDSEFGLIWEVDGSKYRLSSQNIADLKEILDQIELPD